MEQDLQHQINDITDKLVKMAKDTLPDHIHNGFDVSKIDLRDIVGYIQVVSTIPTMTPLNVYQQIQVYHSGATKTLYVYDRTTRTWLAVGGGGSAAGNDTNVQYNNSGAFAGDDSFKFVVIGADFGTPKLTIGNDTGGGVISGGTWIGGIGNEYLRIITESNYVDDTVLTRNIIVVTGDATEADSSSGTLSLRTGLGGTGSGAAGNIDIQTGDTNFGNTGSSITLRAGLIGAGGNAIEMTGNTTITGGITNPSQTYTPSAAATATLDLSLSNHHRITMPAGNVTIALSNSSLWQNFMIAITQDGTGSRTVTWFTTIKWAGGGAPTLTTTASKRDVFGFTRTGTNTYDGFVIGQNI